MCVLLYSLHFWTITSVQKQEMSVKLKATHKKVKFYEAEPPGLKSSLFFFEIAETNLHIKKAMTYQTVSYDGYLLNHNQSSHKAKEQRIEIKQKSEGENWWRIVDVVHVIFTRVIFTSYTRIASKRDGWRVVIAHGLCSDATISVSSRASVPRTKKEQCKSTQMVKCDYTFIL